LQLIILAASRAAWTAGKSNPTNNPMIAMTTRSSTRVKPCRGRKDAGPFWFLTKNFIFSTLVQWVRILNQSDDVQPQLISIVSVLGEFQANSKWQKRPVP
jgi:hypothetical protein